MSDYAEQRYERDQKMAKELSRHINDMGFEGEGFIDWWLGEHRTLQQSFTKLVFKWLYALADVDSHDLRNEASVEAAKKVKEMFGPYGPPIPYI